MGDGFGLPFTRRQFLAALSTGTSLMAVGPRQVALAQGMELSSPGPADWPRFGYDLHNTRFNAREKKLGRDNVQGLKLGWTFEADGPIQTCPTVVGDSLYFGTQHGYQYALDARTGELKWKFKVGIQETLRYMAQGVRSSSNYAAGRIYFGDNRTQVHCLDAATGKQVWQTQLSDERGTQMLCSPAVAKGKVVIGYSSTMGNGEIACLDAETGAIAWRFRTVREAPFGGGGSVWTSPAIDEENNIVYNVTGSLKSFMPPGPMLYSESILAHDLNSGELLWYDQVRPADPFDQDFSCHPMMFDARAPSGYRGGVVRRCVGAGNKAGFFTWDRYTGELYWKTMVTPIMGPELNSTAVGYNRVYVVSNARARRGSMSVTVGLHAYTGDIQWWVPNSAPNNAPVALANGVFYQGLMDGTLEALDAETGQQLWQYKLPTCHRGGIAISNGALYTSNSEPLGQSKAAAAAIPHSIHAFTL